MSDASITTPSVQVTLTLDKQAPGCHLHPFLASIPCPHRQAGVPAPPMRSDEVEVIVVPGQHRALTAKAGEVTAMGSSPMPIAASVAALKAQSSSLFPHPSMTSVHSLKASGTTAGAFNWGKAVSAGRVAPLGRQKKLHMNIARLDARR